MSLKGLALMKALLPYSGSSKEDFKEWLEEVCHCNDKPKFFTEEDLDEAHATAYQFKKILNGELP